MIGKDGKSGKEKKRKERQAMLIAGRRKLKVEAHGPIVSRKDRVKAAVVVQDKKSVPRRTVNKRPRKRRP